MNATRSACVEVQIGPLREADESNPPSRAANGVAPIATSDGEGPVTSGRTREITGTRWEHFPHEADVGIRGIGATKAEAFAQAALALTAVVADPATIRPLELVEVRCSAPSDELLLVDWLNAIIFEMATRRMLFSEFTAAIETGRLRGSARGEAIDGARHRPAVEIKGATCAELRVEGEPDGPWRAQCVVDV